MSLLAAQTLLRSFPSCGSTRLRWDGASPLRVQAASAVSSLPVLRCEDDTIAQLLRHPVSERCNLALSARKYLKAPDGALGESG